MSLPVSVELCVADMEADGVGESVWVRLNVVLAVLEVDGDSDCESLMLIENVCVSVGDALRESELDTLDVPVRVTGLETVS